MIYEDPLYGAIEILPPLEEVFYSDAMQRLGRVHQAGAIYLIDPHIKHTRLEHSVGVMYLVRLFGGSLSEQIAALLHDVSHTAFSHVVDQVFEKAGEDYHEEIWDSVIARSAIPAILRSQGYELEAIVDAEHSLLEQSYPYLCADRLDYCLRDLFTAGWLTREEALAYLKQLTVREGRIGYSTASAESWFKAKFQLLNEQYFRKAEYLYVNHGFSAILKYALAQGILSEEDLLTDDHAVMETLHRDQHGSAMIMDLQQMKGFAAFDQAKAASGLKERKM